MGAASRAGGKHALTAAGHAFSTRPVHEVEEEAAALRAEVARLREALGVWQGAGMQAASLPAQQAPAALQRYRAQIWQLQRQVALMAAELKVCGWAVDAHQALGAGCLHRTPAPASLTCSPLHPAASCLTGPGQRCRGS